MTAVDLMDKRADRHRAMRVALQDALRSRVDLDPQLSLRKPLLTAPSERQQVTAVGW
jgi:hypothetical protein